MLIIISQLALIAAFGQSVRLDQTIALAESEYRTAQDVWIKNDPRLEADLYKGNPVEMKKRIRQAAALRDDLMDKKAVYLFLMIKRLDDMNSRFLAWQTSTVPAEAMKKDLDSEQLRLLDEQDRLEKRIKELPEGDEYTLVRRAMESELSELIGLQNNVAKRIRLLTVIGKAYGPAESSETSELAQKVTNLRNLWQNQREELIRARSSWAKLYSDMEKSLDAGGSKRTKRKEQRAANLQ